MQSSQLFLRKTKFDEIGDLTFYNRRVLVEVALIATLIAIKGTVVFQSKSQEFSGNILTDWLQIRDADDQFDPALAPFAQHRALAVSAMLWLRVGAAEAKAVANAGSCFASRVLIALTSSALRGFFDASAKAAASWAKAVVRADSVAAGGRPRYAVSLSA